MIARAVALLALGLAACAAPSEPEADFAGDPRLGESSGRVCFASLPTASVVGEQKALLLQSDEGQAYLIDLTGVCPELDRSPTISMANRCVSRGQPIMSVISGFTPENAAAVPSCRVRRITEWRGDAVDLTP